MSRSPTTEERVEMALAAAAAAFIAILVLAFLAVLVKIGMVYAPALTGFLLIVMLVSLLLGIGVAWGDKILGWIQETDE